MPKCKVVNISTKSRDGFVFRWWSHADTDRPAQARVVMPIEQTEEEAERICGKCGTAMLRHGAIGRNYSPNDMAFTVCPGSYISFFSGQYSLINPAILASKYRPNKLTKPQSCILEDALRFLDHTAHMPGCNAAKAKEKNPCSCGRDKVRSELGGWYDHLTNEEDGEDGSEVVRMLNDPLTETATVLHGTTS